MKWFLIPLLLLSLFVVACSQPISEGYVYGKHYSPAYTSVTPGYTTESCVDSGKSEDCYPVYHPAVVVYHPEYYELELTSCSSLRTDGDCQTGWAYVDAYQYDHTSVGSYYGG